MRFRVARNALPISNSPNVTRKKVFPLKNYCVVGYTNVSCVAKLMCTVVISTCSYGTILRERVKHDLFTRAYFFVQNQCRRKA